MTIISVPETRRFVGDDSFLDLTTLPVTVLWMSHGVTLRFDGDLDEATRLAVIKRCTTANDNENEIRAQAEAVLDACRTYLALEAPTQAEVLAQVRLLTRIAVALIRLVLRKLDGVN